MKQLVFFLAMTLIFSCKNQKNENYSKNKISSASEKQEHPGKQLLERNCYVCHSPSATEANRIAPPMIAIKKHYIDENTSKETFVKSMQKFIENPNEKNAKMYGAVKRFGLMPKQVYPEKTIALISEYIYENEIQQPEWFEKHFNKERGNGQKECDLDSHKELSFEEKGMKLAMATKSVLAKNLIGKIQKSGTLAALNFCNVKASPLTDSLSIVHKASIKRVSDKPRNLKNKANTEELKAISVFKKDLQLKKESVPILVENSKNVNFYYPIVTNGKCLQCHGDSEVAIQKDVLKQLNKQYPNDLATGYNVNEIRGIWSIVLNK